MKGCVGGVGNEQGRGRRETLSSWLRRVHYVDDGAVNRESMVG